MSVCAVRAIACSTVPRPLASKVLIGETVLADADGAVAVAVAGGEEGES